MNILLAVCAVVAGVIAVLNAAQAVLGRQVLRPAHSRRSPAQLRQESSAAAVAMAAVTLAAVGVLTRLHVGVILGAIVVAGLAMMSIFIRRNRTS
jgi:hypothetical protein